MKINVIPISTAAITRENAYNEITQIASALENLQSTRTLILTGLIDKSWENTHIVARANMAMTEEILKEQCDQYYGLLNSLSLSQAEVPSLSLHNFLEALTRSASYSRAHWVRDAHLAELCTKFTTEILGAALKKRGCGIAEVIPSNAFIVGKVIRKDLKQALVWDMTHNYLDGFFTRAKGNLFILCPGAGFTKTGMMHKTRLNIIEQTVKLIKNDPMFKVVSVKKLLQKKVSLGSDTLTPVLV